LKILALLPDAFGGFGGIAKFNRDLCHALLSAPWVESLTVLPRVIQETPTDLPAGLKWQSAAAQGKLAFAWALAKQCLTTKPDLILCGHLNLLPLALLAKKRFGCPLWQIIHGIEAWETSPRVPKKANAAQVDRYVAVSEFTWKRFSAWMDVASKPWTRLPNCVDLSCFTPGPKDNALVARYGLEGKRVLMTLCRHDSQEQYKGVDEVLDALPALAEEFSDVHYLICGSGDDLPRLQAKAKGSHRVTFAGRIPEEEKVALYRSVDAFVMPGRGEGFGIVYLEAMACGIPVLASRADASQEAVANGAFGELANPADPADVLRGLRDVLNKRRVPTADQLEVFSWDAYRRRVATWSEFVN
jgi:phosphatidyl-myo-inositol dimannoside synthase